MKSDLGSSANYKGALAFAAGAVSPPARGLILTTGGTITITMAEDTAAVTMTLAAGTYPFCIKNVGSIGTSVGFLLF